MCTKKEFIALYGKKSYLVMLEDSKMRNRRNRGYKGDPRGSWKREV